MNKAKTTAGAGRSRPVIGINLDVQQDPPYDWFRLRCNYADAVIAAGGIPLLLPALSASSRLLDWYLSRVQGVLLTGGLDYPPAWYGQRRRRETVLLHPRRCAFDLVLARRVLRVGLPVLGICGGHQLIALARGGALIQHVACPAAHQKGVMHKARFVSDSRLSAIFGRSVVRVNSFHHQAVDPRRPGRDLRVTAYSDDGVVEAIEGCNPSRFVLGVQWHPERMDFGRHGRPLFGAFLRACACAGR